MTDVYDTKGKIVRFTIAMTLVSISICITVGIGYAIVAGVKSIL